MSKPAKPIEPLVSIEKLEAMSVADKVATYRKLRDYKAAVNAKAKLALAPINNTMQLIEGLLLKKMGTDGVKHYATPNGTAAQSPKRSVKVEDKDVFMEWVRETDNLQMLATNIADSEILSWLDRHGELPPGVTLKTFIKVNITKA